LSFTLFFMIAKFYIPGVPSGTIIVMLPILEKYLGFTAEMSAFILAIYILFDPIATAGNVLGNSALVIMLTKTMKRLMKRSKPNKAIKI
jgi:Na+/H+-dicarboxylate symporter